MTTAALIGDLQSFVSGGGILTTQTVTQIVLSRFSSNSDFQVAGSTSTLLYSGNTSQFSTQTIAKGIADQSGGSVAVIDNTAVGRALSGDSGNQRAVQEAIADLLIQQNPGLPTGAAISDAGLILFGQASTRTPGVWDVVSEKFVDLSNGPIKTITPQATVGGVFERTELPRLLEGNRQGTIDGIDLDDLRVRIDSDTQAGIASGLDPDVARSHALEEAANAVRQKSFDDLVSSGNSFGEVVIRDAGGNVVSRTPAIDLGADYLPRGGIVDVNPSTPIGFESGQSGFDALPKIDDAQLSNLAKGAKYLDALGVAGDVLDIGLTIYEAQEQYRNGDARGAANTVANGLGEFAGGALGVGMAALLGLTGPVGIAAALVLGYAGSQAGSGLADRLFDWLVGDDWTDGVADDFSDAELIRLIDPIVLDLDGNGIELTGRINSNVYFDMDGDGIKELTGWVSPTDGLLSIDANANGHIDDINELIGDLGRSGFAELITYDLNNDDVINSSDAVWSQLRVWVDANSDGLTDAGELRTLASLNIQAIDLNFTAVNFTAQGNRIHEQSVFEYTNGTTGLVADIWFDVSNVATDSEITLTGNVTIDDLPDIRGRGDVESLRSVMLTDGALTTLVSGFVAQDLSNLGNARAQAEQIIYRWAGVQSVDPASRGGFIDARKLGALEAFLGTEYLVQGLSNPNAAAAARLTDAWNGLLDGVLARLLMGGPLGDAIADSAVYVPEIDRLLTVQTPDELLESFRAAVPAGDGLAVAGYWAAVLPLAREIVQDVGGTTTGAAYTAAVTAALEGTGLAPFADLLDDGLVSAAAGAVQLGGAGAFRLSSGADNLTLTGGLMAVFAGAGDDIISVSSGSAARRLLDGGDGNDQLQGGIGDDWLDGGVGSDTMAGGAGNDVYTVDAVGDVVLELPGAGVDEVRSAVSYVLAAELENLTLTGALAINGVGNASANRMTGNGAANQLEGLAGDDTLDGGAGADTMIGGFGADTYTVDDTGDVVTETGADVDTVQSSITYTLGSRLENLVLTGAAVNGTGNALNNRLTGNDLGNLLNGGLGNDTMAGGLGDDTYVVESAGDAVNEAASAGTDTVQSSVSFTLANNLENLTLIGALDLNGTGNAADNRLIGNGGDNVLNGAAGNDTMEGGVGDDLYIVEAAGDVVTETANRGTDTVRTSLAAYTLAANVENLQLFLSQDTVARNGTGNGLANVMVGGNGVNVLSGLDGDDFLYGNNGNDTLSGGVGNDLLDGGTGDDSMDGGTGDDTYVVNSALDVVTEGVGGGTDTVQSAVSFILASNLEHLILTGAANIDGQGNAANNQLTGNAGNNNLDGGVGSDTMAGGAGNDVYTVDAVGDVVLELPGAGVDEVRSAVSYVLGLSIENLTLLGSANRSATGNAEANVIVGNAGDNIITGALGRDTLTGNAGADTFVFQRVEDTGNTQAAADRITDFQSAQGDKIDLSGIDANVATLVDDAFTYIGGGAFTAAGQARSFVVGGVTYIALNTDADLVSIEAIVSLTGAVALVQGDFLA